MKTRRRIRYLIILCICLSLYTTGCTRHTAKEDNDALVALKEKADEDFASLNRYLNMAIEEKEYNIIGYLTNTAIDSINARTGSLQQLDVPPSAEKFKQTTIDYVQSLVNVSKAYKSYALLADTLMSVQQLDSLREIIRNAECAMDSMQTVLISVQRDFAREKNMKL
ncbi:MAG: hypothetical protein LBR34_06745 [Prevotella sp.]|jgi:hypothetical protein|nr:hypothetical protein [Prevotella sp.]